MEKVWREFKVIQERDNIRTNRRRYAIADMIIFYEFSVAVISCKFMAQSSGSACAENLCTMMKGSVYGGWQPSGFNR